MQNTSQFFHESGQTSDKNTKKTNSQISLRSKIQRRVIFSSLDSYSNYHDFKRQSFLWAEQSTTSLKLDILIQDWLLGVLECLIWQLIFCLTRIGLQEVLLLHLAGGALYMLSLLLPLFRCHFFGVYVCASTQIYWCSLYVCLLAAISESTSTSVLQQGTKLVYGYTTARQVQSTK